METSGIGEMAQYLNVSVKSVEMLLKALGGSVKGVSNGSVKTVAFLSACFNKEKLMGETKFKNIVKKAVNNNDPLEFFRFNEKDLAKFEELASRYGLLYSKVVDLNKSDGLTEIAFNQSEISQIDHIAKEMGNGKVISKDEYFKNADDLALAKKMEAKVEEARTMPGELDEEKVQKVLNTNSKDLNASQSKNDLKDIKQVKTEGIKEKMERLDKVAKAQNAVNATKNITKKATTARKM